MNKAYHRDLRRTVAAHKKRFFSLAAITALGVAMFAGLQASCRNLRLSADALYDSQNLFDLRIQSTLGLTGEDLSALAALEGVERAEGGVSLTVKAGDAEGKAEARSFEEGGLNQPYLVEGELPQGSGQAAVTQSYLTDTGAQLGDTVTLTLTGEEEEDGPGLARESFVLTGVVLDPMDLNNRESAAAFRVTGGADYTFFLTPEDLTGDTFTDLYLTLEGAGELDCYSEEYEALVSEATRRVESQVQAGREEARWQEVKAQGEAEWADAKAEAEEELADAQAELEEGWAELEDAQAELEDARGQIADGEQELADGWAAWQSGSDRLAEEEVNAEAKIWDGAQQLEDARWQLQQAEEELEEGQARLDEQRAGAEAQLAEAQAQLDAAAPWMSPEELAAAQAQLDEQAAAVRAQLDAAQAEIDAGREEIKAGWKEFNSSMTDFEAQAKDARDEINRAKAELDASRVTLEEAETELEDARAQLAEGEADYAQGLADWEEGQAEYQDAKAEAEEELADARAQLDSLEKARWYVQDRTSLSSYSNLSSDTASIEALGIMFPVIFLTVAVLISLTSVTRMVEEERGLIGLYKALGYRAGAVCGKYLFYAAAACLLGSALGEVGGYLLMPLFMEGIFRQMYLLPAYLLSFDLAFGLGGPALFLAGILGATFLACRGELRRTPAALMRPKAPAAGSRVLLERLPALWNRLRFLDKVTLRNLFRYKKRMAMTVFGIAGCTALMVCGLGLHDSVVAMAELQYGRYYRYDLMVAGSGRDDGALLAQLEEDGAVELLQPIYIETVTLLNQAGEETSIQLMVLPEGETEEWFTLEDEEGRALSLEEGPLLTRNAARILGLEEGGRATVRDTRLRQADVSPAGLAENCLGNNLYLTGEQYQQMFGEFEPNGALIRFGGTGEERTAWAEALRRQENVASVADTQAQKGEFSQNFAIMNAVVFLLTGLAAGLAFVVLFTLSTTNISERRRELATIQVLGFYRREVHAYLNKETLALTALGILLGLPAGRALTGGLISLLAIPAAQVPVRLEPASYLLAAGAALIFALLVQLVTDRILDKIDMVQALKSVE